MPNLPGSDAERDRQMLTRMSVDPELSVDQLKVYPTEVVPFTRIEKWYRDGSYVPYPLKELLEVLIEFKQNVPPWIRLNRVVRDIPGTYQNASQVKDEHFIPTDWRNRLQAEMRERKIKCRCIRCREVGPGTNRGTSEPELMVRPYNSSRGGQEYFISVENDNVIFGFCRLRVPRTLDGVDVFPELQSAALVRELHVYGELVPHAQKTQTNERQTQHGGIGKKLLGEAANIARSHSAKLDKLVVISGVGVRRFYMSQGWAPLPGQGHFLYKSLKPRVSPRARLVWIVSGFIWSYLVTVH